jgi:TRAP transporter TAXI family solute receptor
MMKVKNLYRIMTLLILLIFFVFLQNTGADDENGIGLVTGSKTGTYIRFGQEISEIAKPYGLNIIVKESEGSIDNIKRIRSSENAAIGIVQSDVLGYLKDRTDFAAFADRLRLLFPFYNEEVHLFARKEIEDIKDLQDKTVVIGARGSGNWLTTKNLLRLMNIKPGKSIILKPPEAVVAVLNGEADAMVYVAGKPVKLFSKLERDKIDAKFLNLVDKVHFVPLNHPDILRGEYVTSAISSNDYAWFDGDIQTIAVKAVLVSYDFSSKANSYYELRCEQLALLGQAIRENIDKLKQNGHPKWKEVNLDQKVGIWPLDKCSRYLAGHQDIKDSKENILNELLDYLKQ